MKVFAAAFLLAGALTVAPAHAAEMPTWVSTGPIATARYDAASARLADDDVLLIGGHTEGNNATISSVERWDSATGRWSAAAPLPGPRENAAAVTLDDGRVLVVGGQAGYDTRLSTTQFYDPAANVWSDGPSTHAPRDYVKLVKLADGRVLAVGNASGSEASAGAEIYDPATNAWTLTAPMIATPTQPAVIRLADGRVLVAGGGVVRKISGGFSYGYTAAAQLYDPVSDTWTAARPMHEKRQDTDAVLLPDGRVVVAGGVGPDPQWSFPYPSSTSEVYDPALDAWSAPRGIGAARGMGVTGVGLSDGRAVFVGGWSYSWAVDSAAALNGADWTLSGSGGVGRWGHIAVALSDNSVLVAAGQTAGTSSQRLVFAREQWVAPPAVDPDPDPEPEPEPAPDPVPDATSVPVVPTPVPPAPVTPASTPTAKAATVRKSVASLIVPRTLRASSAGVVKVTVRCSGATACRTQVVLRRGGRRLARATVAIAAGQTRTVSLRLTKADRRKLAGRATRVTVTVGDTARVATLRR